MQEKQLTKLTKEFLQRIIEQNREPWTSIAINAIKTKNAEQIKELFNKFHYAAKIFED